MPLLSNSGLIASLTVREVAGRYRGSVLGILWSLLTPLLMLTVYTLVFGTVFQARWTPEGGPQARLSTSEFALILFAGLIVFQLFADVVNRAPGLVLANPNYVKKVVFPLEILPLVAMGSALFNAGISLLVLLAFMLMLFGSIPPTVLLLPLVIVPFVLLTLGVGWFFASLGVSLRDIRQALGPAMTALMFLSPVFYPASALPQAVRGFLFLNPLTLPIEQAREVLIWGRLPDFAALAVYSAVALGVAALGFIWFQQTRRGFADVI